MQSSQALLEALMKMGSNKIAPTLGPNPYMDPSGGGSVYGAVQSGKGGTGSAPAVDKKLPNGQQVSLPKMDYGVEGSGPLSFLSKLMGGR